MTEFGLIDHIRELCRVLPVNGFEGIGDDCATLPIGDGEALVFTTDMLIEEVHFLRAATSAAELGAKALAVNLSDVAAMGARPVATLLSLALPREIMDSPWIEEFMCGYRDLSQRYHTALIGGDTTASTTGIAINVTAIGRISEQQLKHRADAQVGDIIFVGGSLGESGAGLRDILAGHYDTPFAAIHRNPTPQVEEGIWLGQRREVHAMMDISDGVASDLCHIMERSAVGAEVNTENIPTTVDLETALCGGEDYKLLFTADATQLTTLCADFAAHFGTTIYPIGRITAPCNGKICWLKNGTPMTTDWHGFRHY
ncbi:MAG: thiamine-phosphate kinase [Alistipes sp.]